LLSVSHITAIRRFKTKPAIKSREWVNALVVIAHFAIGQRGSDEKHQQVARELFCRNAIDH
jgi:hypothetical protein